MSLLQIRNVLWGNMTKLVGMNPYYAATPIQQTEKGILWSIHTQLSPGIPTIMAIVRHRANTNDWLRS